MKKNLSLASAVLLIMLVQSSCSTIENSFEAKDSNREDYNRGDGADRGGAQFETAIWSSDPNRKTLPKALGADGKEK